MSFVNGQGSDVNVTGYLYVTFGLHINIQKITGVKNFILIN